MTAVTAVAARESRGRGRRSTGVTRHSTEAARRLGITHPIVQGPFGGGLSTTTLAACVSDLGGLGSYGAHVLEPERLGPLVDELRGRTSSPFAVNLWVSDHDPGGLDPDPETIARARALFEPYFRELGHELPDPPPRHHHPRFAEQVEALLEARPPVFSFVFGIPPASVLEACRARGIVTVGACTTLAEARALDEARVDVIVASGFEAGGHRPSFLAPAEQSLMGTLALVPQVVDRVKAPVVAAGGIGDARGVRAALALGAGAAQLGTAFLACEESGASPEHKELLLSDRAERTQLTRAFTGRLARGLVNRWVEEVGPRQDLAPFPVQSWYASKLKAAAARAGRTDLVSLWGGQVAPVLKHRTAPALMQTLLRGL